MIQDFQDSQNVAQLSLTITSLVVYRRLLPDERDHLDDPIDANHLFDLDDLFYDISRGNSGRVAEQMVFALGRVLPRFSTHYAVFTTVLQNTLDEQSPLLCFYAEYSDRYLHLRIEGYSHKTAISKLLPKSQARRDEVDLD